QTIEGSGTLRGGLAVGASGTVAPGFTNAIGTLTVTNGVSLGGTALMKINRAGAPTSDKLVAQSITIPAGATLTVTNIGNTNLAPGDPFTLFSPVPSGSFPTVNLPPLPCGGVAWTNKLAINGTIAVTGTPCVNLTPTNITAVVVGNMLQLSWPADHVGWTLQT